MRRFLFFSCLISGIILLLQSACSYRKADSASVVIQDTLVLTEKAYTGLLLDSTSVAQFIATDKSLDSFAAQIMDFYARRNFQAAWFVDDSLSTQAYNFIGLLKNQIATTGDSSIADPRILNDADSLSEVRLVSVTDRPLTDLLLTAAFFRYAQNEYYGTDKPLKDLEWYIPRRKKDYVRLLNALINSDSAYAIYEPSNAYYKALKTQLIKYRRIETSGGLTPVPYFHSVLLLKDTAEKVFALKKYLSITDGYPTGDTSLFFNDSLKLYLRKFQKRMGLTISGQPDSLTVSAMNVPLSERIMQIMINLERLRWLPEVVPDNYLLVNIPEFRLHVFENQKQVWSMNVVVGKEATATTVFANQMRYVVFNPYWNVPQSIIVKELLPVIKRNPGYLIRKNMEVVGASGRTISPYKINWKKFNTRVPFEIREKPGPKNSLGLIKFLFPNQFNTYMHDTPAKNLFEKETRAFSHGCIRLEEAEKLARYVFRNDSIITPDKITEMLASGKEKWITLKAGIPVYIVYFTAWVDHQGELNFRNDIYGRDEKLKAEVFAK